jgi:hypothetical protein
MIVFFAQVVNGLQVKLVNVKCVQRVNSTMMLVHYQSMMIQMIAKFAAVVNTL